ncbi:hypothetical protein ACS0TY_004963 [Phlomoides rotata]
MAETKLRIKLLIDTVGKRVLFGEAGKDCVDFLFFILSLPLSTLIRLLGKQQMVGSLGNLYQSFEALDESYIQPNITKDTLLRPAVPLPGGYSVPLLPLNTPLRPAAPLPGGFSFPLFSLKEALEASTVKNFYSCPVPVLHSSPFGGQLNPGHSGCNYVSVDPRAICPDFRQVMSRRMTYVAPPRPVQKQDQNCSSGGGGGFVKDVVTYMVMDDLVVQPMSTISSVTLLNKFNINNVSALEEKVVDLGMNEAVKLLTASLVSKTVLTHVFLNGDN